MAGFLTTVLTQSRNKDTGEEAVGPREPGLPVIHASIPRCPNKALPLLDASSLAVWIHYQLIKDKDLPFNEGTHGASKFCENRQLNRQGIIPANFKLML